MGQREAGTQVYRSGMDSVVRGHWTSYLQMVCGTINVYVLYVYSTEPVLSAELRQGVTKELVTNGLTFKL